VFTALSSRTLKNSIVEPVAKVPYLISVCTTRSSADSMGVFMRSIVKNAAKLAVYDDIIIKMKNHHTVPMTRPEKDLKSNGQTYFQMHQSNVTVCITRLIMTPNVYLPIFKSIFFLKLLFG